ncbi:putative oxidoreductase, FAD-binding [Aspergillus lucknowensis]|uniref:FAD-binding FR-type domain-containing protein n=1 Tax=Aspergillus lucknowensis TaxID=176173 RepID=A0ABR4M0Z3_9EURO
MTAILTTGVSWHEGEDRMHQLMRVPYQDNPTVPFLTPRAGLLMKQSPLIAIGALDQEGRPWASVWGGEDGFITPTSSSSFEIRTPVGKTCDPVVESLLLDSTGNSGRLVAFLAVDLESRRRVKLFGKVNRGWLDITDKDERIRAGIAHLTVHVDGSLGNCPKYLNAKHIVPAPPEPKLISETPQLHPDAIELLNRADCLFISSSHGTQGMDTNIRGGPPGFVRVISNKSCGAVFVYPEYSGNRLYQTLGNLQTTALAGFVFPDFENGNALFATGSTEILVGKDASAILPRSNIVVRVTVTAARFVEKALSFRGVPGKPSPYNPSVRYLTSEKTTAAALGDRESTVTATLIKKEIITPSIGRFRFRISDPKEAGSWAPGQYATFSFYDELNMGYSHMRDDDPSSVNDDFVRTFTISSSPGHGLLDQEFEITARKHGNVTSSLFRTNEKAGLEVPLKGFGGDFRLTEQASDDILPFIAGGIGITPVLAHLPVIDIGRLRLLWSISVKDIALVLDTFKRFPELSGSTTLFITGLDSQNQQLTPELEGIASSRSQIKYRRIEACDIDLSLAEVWYFCGSPALKVPVFNWLGGKKIVYEDFDY